MLMIRMYERSSVLRFDLLGGDHQVQGGLNAQRLSGSKHRSSNLPESGGWLASVGKGRFKPATRLCVAIGRRRRSGTMLESRVVVVCWAVPTSKQNRAMLGNLWKKMRGSQECLCLF